MAQIGWDMIGQMIPTWYHFFVQQIDYKSAHGAPGSSDHTFSNALGELGKNSIWRKRNSASQLITSSFNPFVSHKDQTNLMANMPVSQDGALPNRINHPMIDRQKCKFHLGQSCQMRFVPKSMASNFNRLKLFAADWKQLLHPIVKLVRVTLVNHLPNWSRNNVKSTELFWREELFTSSKLSRNSLGRDKLGNC